MVKVTTILADFASWSTVACVRNVVYSETKLLRFVWFIVFIAMIVAFITQLVMIILKYLSYPSDIATTMVFSSQPFPDVTFCSYNPFKLSVVNANPDFGEIKRMLAEYGAAELGQTGSNEFGFQGLNRFSRQDRAADLLILLAGKLSDAEKAPALYEVEELVTECLFAGVICDPSSIEVVPDPVYGRCFVYKGENTTITRSGLAHGLRLILTANLADSRTFESDYLPTTSRVGVRMTVNEDHSFVSLDSHGFNVGVGYQTSIAVSKLRKERAKEPYGECVDAMEPNYYSYLPYTIDSCFTTCMQRRIVERCGCASPVHRKADNETWCSTPAQASCIASHRGDQANANESNVNQLDDCGCKPPCNQTQFRTTISVLTYPAFGYTVGVGTTEQLNNQKQEQESQTTTTTTVPSTLSVTTEATTTTACSDYTHDPKYVTLAAIPGASLTEKKFKVHPPDASCVPVFECNPYYATEWWTCWPCFYECPGTSNSNGYRLPSAAYSTPNINCRDFFSFAKVATGWQNSNSPVTARPAWTGWNRGISDPTRADCEAELAKMTTTTVAPFTLPGGNVDDCAVLETMLLSAPGSFALDHQYRRGDPKPSLTKIPTTTGNWYDDWPCSYPCGNNVRFPTTGTTFPFIQRIKCRDLVACFNIDGLPAGYPTKPIFNNWNSPGSNDIDCTTATGTGTAANTSGRKKRSAIGGGSSSIAIPGKGSCEAWNTNFRSVDDCKTWYKNNGMIVNVFYETLEYRVLTESAVYSIPSAINDLGGQAGLWLGLSVVSVVECIGLLLMISLFCITGKRMAVREDTVHRHLPEDDDN